MKNLWLLLFFGGNSGIALAQEEACVGVMCEVLKKFPGVGMIVVYLVGAQLILRGLAEGLLYISAKTETETDNKVAAWVSQASWVLGGLLAKFGYSMPKAIIEEKASQQK